MPAPFPAKTANGGKGVRIPDNAHLGDAASGHAKPPKGKAPSKKPGQKGC